MTVNDPLYVSLIKAYKEKERKADQRNALLCAIIANCMGGGQKKFEISDFMPKEQKTEEQMAAELKAYLSQYEDYRRNGELR